MYNVLSAGQVMEKARHQGKFPFKLILRHQLVHIGRSGKDDSLEKLPLLIGVPHYAMIWICMPALTPEKPNLFNSKPQGQLQGGQTGAN